MSLLIPQTSRARRAALSLLFSVFGLLMLIAAAGYGLYQSSELRGQVELQEKNLSALESEADALQREVETIRDGSISALINAGFIEAKAIAVPTDETTVVGGETLPDYNFIVWLDVPFARKADIREVIYQFPDPSFLEKEQISSEPSNGYAVGYLGWGDLPLVPIKIIPDDAGAEAGRIDFPMRSRLRIIRDDGNR